MAIDSNLHQKLANSLRILSADMVERAQSGHPGMPLGMADVIAVLFADFLRFNVDDPKWPNRDRFILSAGHGSALLYSLLHLLGYQDGTLDELKNFRQLGAKTAGHPEYGMLSGIEATTGPLGQGIANGVGMAIAEKKIKTRFNFIDHKIYVVAGDGCLMEGISHESCSLAGHLKLNNLIVLFDSNKISIDGPTSLSNSDDVRKRFESYNWDVLETDGHDFEQIYVTLNNASINQQKPTLIICNTIIGKGCETKAGSEKSHGAPLGSDELAKLRENLDWPHAPFEIPDEIYAEWMNVSQRSQSSYRNWINKHHAELAVLDDYLDCRDLGNLTNHLQKYRESILENAPAEATRKSFGKILEHFDFPHLTGGSADLSGSNCVINNKNTKVITKDDFSGNFIHYGIREHAMAAIMNGLSLYGGMVPFGGTFLVFSDYCRSAIRLSALMKRRVIYVMTHDSIGLGEDGPTHQPIEHLASLRAMPNLLVLRPADAIETVECFSIALQSKETPSVLVLSRQNLPAVRTNVNENFSEKGAYIIKESSLSEAKVVIFASGSEVQIALEVQKTLEYEYQIGVRVISVVSFELFNKQNQEYQSEILTQNAQIRVAIETSSMFGWSRFLGMDGIFVGMLDNFGESAPAKDLFKHFKINAENVVQKVLEKMS